jgi:tRNA-specific adenosine deaminase 3
MIPYFLTFVSLVDRFSLLPGEQYLCTGLDLFASKEPDLLSSMALVHSRIRIVVYRESDCFKGCLGSRAAIHCMRTLNHRFQVYRVVTEDESS